MTELKKRKKALSVSPLKTSQTMGAAYAFLGLGRSIPVMHGSQGCTAFAKVFFVRHFREPIPLQTTAMDQVSSVMGADENVVEALKVISEKNHPSVIGVVTTGLAETQGADLQRAYSEFRKQCPQFDDIEVVMVNSPDFSGCFETGYAKATQAIIEKMVPKKESPQQNTVGLKAKQVNVLCHANLTPGDLEFIRESIESFGLRPLMIPDLSESLDGHLADDIFNPLSAGGVSSSDIKTAGESKATFVIGDSLKHVGELLEKRTSVPSFHFNHLMTLSAVDRWLFELEQISLQPVPHRWKQQRRQLQDVMLDTHFMMGNKQVAMAADSDLIVGFHEALSDVGTKITVAVTPVKQPSLNRVSIPNIQIGDLEDLEQMAAAEEIDLVLGNSHVVESSKRLGVPILRVGFPQYDLIGGFQRCWIGYRGIQNLYFEMANIFMHIHQDIEPYYSQLSQKKEKQQDSIHH